MITKREKARLKELIQKITEESDIKEIMDDVYDRGLNLGLGNYWNE